MKTVTTEHAKAELSRLVRQSVKGHEAFRITHEDGEAVLLSREDYDTLMETLEILIDSERDQVTKSHERRSP